MLFSFDVSSVCLQFPMINDDFAWPYYISNATKRSACRFLYPIQVIPCIIYLLLRNTKSDRNNTSCESDSLEGDSNLRGLEFTVTCPSFIASASSCASFYRSADVWFFVELNEYLDMIELVTCARRIFHSGSAAWCSNHARSLQWNVPVSWWIS
jgi:hypothetical protein